jgi:hypothetical protein
VKYTIPNFPGIISFTNPPKMKKTNEIKGESGFFGILNKNIRLYAFQAFGDAFGKWQSIAHIGFKLFGSVFAFFTKNIWLYDFRSFGDARRLNTRRLNKPQAIAASGDAKTEWVRKKLIAVAPSARKSKNEIHFQSVKNLGFVKYTIPFFLKKSFEGGKQPFTDGVRSHRPLPAVRPRRSTKRSGQALRFHHFA